MSESVLPLPEEVPSLVPLPGSVVWRYQGDVRLLAMGGYAILLQVAHPTVGAGVTEHSNFKADPWGRLLRTLDYSYAITYGGPKLAADIGRRVREMHRHIKGVRPDGVRYHALEPEAYSWVHATLALSIALGHERFGTRMSPEELELFWAQWRRQGRLIGVRERDLPETWADVLRWFDDMVDERLQDNTAVQDALSAFTDPKRPPVRFMNEATWRVARVPLMRPAALATVGLLPPALRERFGVPWTSRQELELRALSATWRASTAVMPAPLRNVGPGYLRWRREALTRGDVAAPSRAPVATAA